MHSLRTEQVIDSVLSEVHVMIECGVHGPVHLFTYRKVEIVGCIDASCISPSRIEHTQSAVPVIDTCGSVEENVLGEIDEHITGSKQRLCLRCPVSVLGQSFRTISVTEEGVIDRISVVNGRSIHIVTVCITYRNCRVTEKGVAYYRTAF